MKHHNHNRFKEIIVPGIAWSILLFIIFGIVTVLIPNRYFIRMTSVTALDYAFLLLTSVLTGFYISLHSFQKKHNDLACDAAAAGGWLGGFLGFGCPICNKILVLVLGVAGVLTFIEPYRPLIGLTGVIFMGLALYSKSMSVLRLKVV